MKLGLTVPNHQAVESHPHPASSPPLPLPPPPPLSLWDRCSPVSPVTLLAPSDCRRHMPGPATIPVWTSLSPSRLELYARPLLGAKRLEWGTTNDHCSRLTDPIDKQTNKYIDGIPQSSTHSCRLWSSRRVNGCWMSTFKDICSYFKPSYQNRYCIREGILNQNKYLILKQTKDNSTIN